MAQKTVKTTYRGRIRDLVASGETLRFVTTHPEGQPTPLYALRLSDDALFEVPLSSEKGAKGLCQAGEDLFILTADDAIERWREGQQQTETWRAAGEDPLIALRPAAGDRLALIAGTSLIILSQASGEELQRFDLEDETRALAISPNGQWLAVGTVLGRLAIFTCEGKETFEHSDTQKIHEGAVTALLFDEDDIRVLSAGADSKILHTHARGRLDPEDRGGKSRHDEPVTAILRGPGKVFYTGSRDRTFKCWPSGLTRQRPFTVKDGVGAVIALALVDTRGRPHLAIATDETEIRLWDLEDEGRPKDRDLVIEGAMAYAQERLNDKDTRVRLAALEDLARYNDAPALELLSQRVQRESDHELSVRATQLLGETGNPRAITSLEELLRSNDGDVRVAALEGLRALEGQQALRPLTLALDTNHADIGLLTTAALAELANDDDEALSELIKALDRRDDEVRVSALDHLQRITEHSGPQEALLIALRSSQHDIRRLALVRLFQRQLLELPEVQAALRRHGEDADDDVRLVAFLVSVLSQPLLAEALRERDAELHRQLAEIETFGQEDPPESPQPEAIRVAVERLGDVEREPLLQAMASRALDTCSRGATALATLQDSRAFGTLLQLSRESDTSTRVEVCRALKSLDDARGIARLRLMIRDPQASVRDAAFSALIRLEAERPLDAAEAGLMAEHEDIRRRALQVLIEDIKATPPISAQEPAWQLLERSLNDAFPEVRSEAFKASLNLQFAGGGEKTLRFALASLHRDIRNEVLVEIMAQMQEPWAWPLLLELLRDPDAGLRKEAFDFALKRSKGRLLELLSATLDCPYSDLRAAATKELRGCKEEGSEELLFRSLDDEDEGVRQLGLEALLASGSPGLSRVMKSSFPDVRARAAHARAIEGDEEALIPLLQIITEPEPELSDLRGRWQDRIRMALEGLAELGSEGAITSLEPLLESKDGATRKLAAKALASCSRPGHTALLQKALRHQDAAVRLEAALGLAACGDTTGTSIIFESASPAQALQATLGLGAQAENNLLSFLDHRDAAVRLRAFKTLMLLELASPTGGNPQRCLAGLSAATPEVRLKSAEALESYADPAAFQVYVVALLNDSGDDKPWTLPEETVRDFADALTRAEPWLRYRASALVASLEDKKPDAFERGWSRFSARYKAELTALRSSRGELDASQRPGASELSKLVFGTYVGLSRLQESGAAQVRQTALRRLYNLGQRREDLAPSVRPVLILALADSNQTVRKLAFEFLCELITDVQELCAEALASAQRDVGALGFQKLLAEADASTSRQLLEQVLRRHQDGLEHEASKALQASLGEVEVARIGFEAKSESLRKDAVLAMVRRYDEAPAAAQALREALEARPRDVRILAAMELASKRDAAAFEALSELLKSDRKGEQRQAIKGLTQLGDERAAQLFLDRIAHDPAGTALRKELFEGVGLLRSPTVLEPLLEAIRRNRQRDFAFQAAFQITGYDQPVEGEEGSPEELLLKAIFGRSAQPEPEKLPEWERKQHPRDPAALAKLLEVVTRVSDEQKVQALLPAARWCRTSEVNDGLGMLASFPKPAVRHSATEALGWRLRERGGDAAPLLKALEHEDEMTRFLAAEGLALHGRKEGITILLASVELLPNLQARQRAVKALGKLGDEQALDLLLRIINETGHALQEEAAEALGHMRDSDQAEKVYKTLARLSEGSYGVALSALSGLRYFASLDAWSLIRGRINDDSWQVREHVARLLQHDRDPDKARSLLIRRIEEDDDRDVIEAAFESLRGICGEESLEPHYALACCGDWRLLNQALERLKEKGDPAALLEILPKVQEAYVTHVVDVLLSREPLPLKEAAQALAKSSQERTLRVAAQILGRGGDQAKAHGASLATACERYGQIWRAERAEISDADPALATKMERSTSTFKLLLWSCGRLEVGGEALIAATAPELFKEIREAALTGLSKGIGGEAGLDALARAISDADAGIRALAASGIRKLAPERAGALAEQVLDDRTSLDRLLDGVETADSQAALRKAAATVHHQGVALPHLVARGDLEGLEAALNDASLSETARLGALEGLGRMAREASEELLAAFAKGDADEELRRAAWRALRRSKRTRQKRAAMSDSSNGAAS